MKHVLITGASSGIGAAITARLLAEGWRVTALSRREPEIRHQHLSHVAVDLADSEALQAVVSTLAVPDAIVHAAGIMLAAPLGELDVQRSAAIWRLHIGAAEILANHFAPQMTSGGRIVLLGSRTSRGAAGRSQYVASKAAMVGMARSWAAELAPRGITVNVVAPGATATPMLKTPGRASSPPKTPPIGRLIEPQEVASMVGWLLTPDAAAVTGQELVMCGGASLS